MRLVGDGVFCSESGGLWLASGDVSWGWSNFVLGLCEELYGAARVDGEAHPGKTRPHLQIFGAGVGGAGGICCGSLKMALAYERDCCLDCRSAVFRQPRGRLSGIELMVGVLVGRECVFSRALIRRENDIATLSLMSMFSKSWAMDE